MKERRQSKKGFQRRQEDGAASFGREDLARKKSRCRARTPNTLKRGQKLSGLRNLLKITIDLQRIYISNKLCIFFLSL